MTAPTDTATPIWLRILQFPLIRIIILGGGLFFMMMVNNGFMEKFKATPAISIVVTIGMGLLAMAVYVGWGRLIERRTVSELSLAGFGGEWLRGVMIGAGLITTCVIILMILGMYRIEGFNPPSYMIPAVAMALSAGTFEELFFRGVLYKSLEDLLGSWIAIVLSSLVFGFVHLLNPEGTIVGAVYISVEAGLLLSAAYVLTRRLWLAIGVHMAWNYTLSAVFSGIVSGGVSDPGLFKATIEGPEFLTGGNFGLESSIFALIICTAAGIVLITLAIRRGHLLPPPWRR